ncbi:uncharacterized protein LOC110680332 [Aedes aegypti]|uniref:Gustatory receptor n=1 Tax=Aedes aegypti TaxID=7159 RepID=A0A1S4FU22_AEDAE|nr:gustatory receptor 80 [Aedes aegypti]XP_021711847.1 uncharacterized protein LOC110680332 [Aedes aegypti]
MAILVACHYIMEKHFVRVNWSLFLIFSSAGLVPFSIDKRTLHVRESVGKFILWLLVVSINITCFYQIYSNSLRGNWHGMVVKFSQWCILILITVDAGCILVQALLCRRNHMLLINDIVVDDFIIREKYRLQLNDQRIKRRTLIKILLLGLHWSLIHVCEIISTQEKLLALQKALTSVPLVWLLNVRLSMQIFYIDLVAERLHILNGELQFLGNEDMNFANGQPNFREVIRRVQQTYTAIWKCFRKINCIFGWSTVTLVLKLFVLLIITSFWCINGQKSFNNNGWLYLESSLSIVFIISSLALLCHSAANCKRKSLDTAEALLKPDYDYEDLDVRDFLAQMQHQPFVTSANGFFDIDYCLLGSTLATTATYIVIMLQLEGN